MSRRTLVAFAILACLGGGGACTPEAGRPAETPRPGPSTANPPDDGGEGDEAGVAATVRPSLADATVPAAVGPGEEAGNAAVAGLLAEVREVSATEREVPQGLFGALLGGGTSLEAASLLRQVRIVPIERDGAMVGYKLFGIRADNPAGTLGLRNGDVARSVDGLPLTDGEHALAAFRRAVDAVVGETIALTVERDGQPVELRYRIVEPPPQPSPPPVPPAAPTPLPAS